MDSAALRRLADEPFDWRWKGAPVVANGSTVREANGSTVREFVASNPSLFDAGFLPPVMVLRESALASNLRTMAEFCRGRGVELAPHGKTHMSPQLALRQIEAGAWGITVATPTQARVYRSFGARRLLLANELVDPAAVAWVSAELAEDPGFIFVCYVDSEAGVDLLGAALAAAPGSASLDVLVELGQPGTRTGCRTVGEAVAVARAAALVPRLRIVGISGYEGVIGHGDDTALPQVQKFLRRMREAGEAIAPVVPPGASLIASAGGSMYFDLVADELAAPWQVDRPVTVILRSGCYLAHDSLLYRRGTPFGRRIPGALSPAIEVWGTVLSLPEPGLAFASVGRRDVSYDAGLPVPELVRRPDGSTSRLDGAQVTDLNDQHAYLRVPTDVSLQVGDWLRFGISHPCTTFDKWHLIPVVDDNYRVIDIIHTFF